MTMIPVRELPDWAGDERTQLRQVMDYQRATIHLKCEGLTDEQARQRLTPSPLTSIAGVVGHLLWVEYFWFIHVLGRQDVEFPWSDEHPDADWEQGDTRSLRELLDAYEEVCERARSVVAALDLDAVPDPESRRPISVRATMLHMIEETARHAGHIDILRELTDGATGE